MFLPTYSYRIMLFILYYSKFEDGCIMSLVQIPQLMTIDVSVAPTYEHAITMKNEMTWEKLRSHTVGEFIELWLSTMISLTAKNYRSGMRRLIERGYVHPEMTLQAFALLNSNAIVDRIKRDDLLGEKWSECTRQSRAACFISFTYFLSRRLDGMIKKALPCKEGSSKTFYRVRDKVNTQSMTLSQWAAFLRVLSEINERDCLIAKIILQGAKRVNEVLKMTSDQISWDECKITFRQSKTKGSIKDTIITYPKSIMNALKKYAVSENGLVFTTRTGCIVSVGQLAKTFEKAGIKARIPFKVTPHVLRASAITHYKLLGFSDSDVMKISGHASAEMVNAYDKSSIEDNASKKVCLIT